MENFEKNQQELLKWNRPEVKRLTVSLDTQISNGSGVDGGAFNDPCV